MGCGPGTFNPAANQGSCGSCDAGSYQDGPGGTACKSCTAGHYCAEGASAPLPCPGGTHQNTSLSVMTGVEQCVVCGEGTYCTVGASVARLCAPGTYGAGIRTGDLSTALVDLDANVLHSLPLCAG